VASAESALALRQVGEVYRLVAIILEGGSTDSSIPATVLGPSDGLPMLPASPTGHLGRLPLTGDYLFMTVKTFFFLNCGTFLFAVKATFFLYFVTLLFTVKTAFVLHRATFCLTVKTIFVLHWVTFFITVKTIFVLHCGTFSYRLLPAAPCRHRLLLTSFSLGRL
jgi:hypothetical protein